MRTLLFLHASLLLLLLSVAGIAGDEVRAESPVEFLRRVLPVIQRNEAVDKIREEMKKVQVAKFDLHGDETLEMVADQLNIVVRAHDSAQDAVQIPLIRVDPALVPGTRQYEKLHGKNLPAPADMPPENEGLRIQFQLRNVKLYDALMCTAKLATVEVDITPDAIWLRPSHSDVEVLVHRVYAIPAALCGAGVEKWFNARWTDPDPPAQSRAFDEKSRSVMLKWGNQRLEEFEAWYAGELIQAGYNAETKRAADHP